MIEMYNCDGCGKEYCKDSLNHPMPTTYICDDCMKEQAKQEADFKSDHAHNYYRDIQGEW